MKKTKIIVPALGMLLLSTAASVTGTVAWFSMNTSVTVSGMEVKTKVSSNLKIAATNSEASFSDALVQARKALLEPASTTNGYTFFYHDNSKLDASGKASDAVYTQYNENVELENTDADKAKVDYAFNVRYGINGTGDESGATDQAKWVSRITEDNMTSMVAPAYAYVDYTFYLKATSSEDVSELNLKTVNLMYNDAVLAGNSLAGKAWRVGVFKEGVEKGGAGSAVSNMTLVSILTLAGAENSYTGTAATSTSARGAVTYNAEAQIDDQIDAGETEYYKVVTRLWLEGEDTTCNNETYALLTSSWKLELEFTLDKTNSGATNITSSTTII